MSGLLKKRLFSILLFVSVISTAISVHAEFILDDGDAAAAGSTDTPDSEQVLSEIDEADTEDTLLVKDENETGSEVDPAEEISDVPENAATSGTCGDNLTWTLEEGLLTISGTGKMYDYSPAARPWGNDYWRTITDVVVESGVESIGNCAFYVCSSLKSVTLQNGVTSIGHDAFSDCSNLTSITIPDSMTVIGDNAFTRCSSLTGITIPDGVTSIGHSAFFGCSSLANVTIPDSVTSIGFSAFSDCRSFTSVTIPDSVTSVEMYVFSGCSSLTSVTIPNSVTSIGKYAFQNCSSLTGITIPDSVTSMGHSVFTRCSNLTSITIPDSLTAIGSSTFAGCTSLTSVTIPESVTAIGSSAFSGCSSLAGVAIPDSVTSIEEGTFSGCSSLKKVDLSENLTYIGEEAFSGCTGIESIVFPQNTRQIDERAFSSCKNLKTVTIPQDVTSIGNAAFRNCTGLKDVIYLGTQDKWNSIQISYYNDALLNAEIHYIVVKGLENIFEFHEGKYYGFGVYGSGASGSGEEIIAPEEGDVRWAAEKWMIEGAYPADGSFDSKGGSTIGYTDGIMDVPAGSMDMNIILRRQVYRSGNWISAEETQIITQKVQYAYLRSRDPVVYDISETTVAGLENAVQLKPGIYHPFTVAGAGQAFRQELKHVEGDTVWIPSYWVMDGETAKNNSWMIGFREGLNQAKEIPIQIYLQKQVFSGGEWTAAGYDYITATLKTAVYDESGEEGGGSNEVGKPMYRLYNPYSGEHFYTANVGEMAGLLEKGWKYEGVGWYAPVSGGSPVIYRLYNPKKGFEEHHYTADQNEIRVLKSQKWNLEGPAWASADSSGVPVYRLFNKTARNSASSHHYTTDVNEKNVLSAGTWRYEGVAWYGVKKATG